MRSTSGTPIVAAARTGPSGSAGRLCCPLVVGVALSGVVASAPLALPPNEIQTRTLQLVAAHELAPPGLPTADAMLSDAGLTGVLAPYIQLFTNTFDNLQNIAQGISADPLPFVQQVLANQLEYSNTVEMALNNAAADLDKGMADFSAGLQTAFETLTSGDVVGAFSGAQTALQDLLVSLTLTVVLDPLGVEGDLGGPLGDLLPILTIPQDMADNLGGLVSALTDTSIFVGLQQPLTDHLGLPLVLFFAALGPLITTVNALGATGQEVVDDLQSGDLLAALGAVIDAPANLANAFLNGHATIDPGGLGLPLPVSGILGGLEGISFGGNDLDGTPLGGLFSILLELLPQQLAEAIGADAAGESLFDALPF